MNKAFLICDQAIAYSPEVTAEDTNGIVWANLLKLLTGRSLVAGKVVDGADGSLLFPGDMKTDLPRGRKDHGIRIFRIEGAVGQNRSWIDDIDVQVKAAFAASMADHVESSLKPSL
jgi:hypothetical protein